MLIGEYVNLKVCWFAIGPEHHRHLAFFEKSVMSPLLLAVLVNRMDVAAGTRLPANRYSRVFCGGEVGRAANRAAATARRAAYVNVSSALSIYAEAVNVARGVVIADYRQPVFFLQRRRCSYRRTCVASGRNQRHGRCHGDSKNLHCLGRPFLTDLDRLFHTFDCFLQR